MKATLFWHGQFVSTSNSFKYWRGWVSDVDGSWHFYYQFGRMSGYGKAGSSRVGCTQTGSKLLAESTLRDKVYSKGRKGYVGKWYYDCDLAGFDFPLDVAYLDWQLPTLQTMPIITKSKVAKTPAQVMGVQPDDDVLAERRSPLSIGWRLDV